MATPVTPDSYKEIVIFLTTAGVVVPLFHRLRVSPVLGFLGVGRFWGRSVSAGSPRRPHGCDGSRS